MSAHDAREDQRAELLIRSEDLEQPGGVVEVSGAYLPREVPRRGSGARVERPGQIRREPGSRKQPDRSGAEPGKDGLRPVPEKEGGGPNAQPLVVRLVLVAVERVVHEGPAHAGAVQRQDVVPRRGPVHRRPAHDGAPVEGQAEDCLGPVRVALHERVGDHQGHHGEAKLDALGIEAEEHAEAQRELPPEEGDRLRVPELAGRQRSLLRPRHPAVQVSVPEIVDGAPR